MATFILTGNIDTLVGAASTRVTVVRIQSSHPIAPAGGGVVLERETLVPVVDGMFEVTLQRDAVPTGYGYIVIAEQVGMVWYLDVPATGDADLSDAVMDALPWTNRADIDHGNVSGAVELSAAYGVHEMTLTGDAELTPDGRGGADLAVLIHPDSHAATLGGGAEWFGGAAPDFGTDDVTLTFVRFPSGWLVYASAPAGEPVEVTPAAVTFNDTGNVTTVPGTTGVQYKRAGVNVSAGTISGEPGGSITYTAVAKTGYVIATGATVSWNHTYPALPGWSVIVLDTFTAADGVITSHTPDTTPGTGGWRPGATWTEPGPGSINGWSITGNKVTKDPAAGAGGQNNSLNIGTGDRDGIGIGIDYTVAVQGDTANPVFALAIGSHLTVQMNRTGGNVITADNGGGHGSVTLTGTTSGFADTGRFSIRMIGTALSVLIDDVEVATGTMFESHDDDDFVGLYMTTCGNSTFDNFTVEEYVL